MIVREGEYFCFKCVLILRGMVVLWSLLGLGKKICSAFWRINRLAFFNRLWIFWKVLVCIYGFFFSVSLTRKCGYWNLKTLTFQSLNENEVEKTQLFTAVLSHHCSKILSVRWWVDFSIENVVSYWFQWGLIYSDFLWFYIRFYRIDFNSLPNMFLSVFQKHVWVDWVRKILHLH